MGAAQRGVELGAHPGQGAHRAAAAPRAMQRPPNHARARQVSGLGGVAAAERAGRRFPGNANVQQHSRKLALRCAGAAAG
jgi:hypothetical protein